jgi:hypothetical protein
MTKQVLPHGMPTMEAKAIRPANYHARPITSPPQMNQMRLPMAFMAT